MLRVTCSERMSRNVQRNKTARHQARIIQYGNVGHYQLDQLGLPKIGDRNKKLLRRIDWPSVNFYFDRMATVR